MASNQTFTFNIKAIADMKDVQTNIQNIQQSLGKLKLPDNLKTSFKTTFSNLEKEISKYQNLLNNGIKTNANANALEQSGKNIVRLYDEIVKKVNSLDNSALKKAFEDIGSKEVEKLCQQLTGLENDLKNKLSGQKIIDFTGAKNELKSLTSQFQDSTGKIDAAFKTISNSTINSLFHNIDIGRLDLAEKNLEKIENKAKELNNVDFNNWVQKLRNGFNQLKNSTEISDTTSKIQQLKQELNSVKAETITKLVEQFNQGKINVNQLEQGIVDLTTTTSDWGHTQAQANKELEQVKSRIQYFFGLNNAVNLVKRSLRDAYNTIKELDKAMTETAVVTDFSVGDMWAQLPDYTKRANELGVTTKAAYEAATLYYQQGLKTNEVMAMSNETLKMARIAGLDAAVATDRMTNAIRGFNMEINTMNAQRIDDVYSKLAAISASNVDEISTAMTKVASLAHNANMEFETTAAFLAQIIETTRESAETAGTALKTVVARFSEVKKLVDEGELKGNDSEGELIDVNKVSQALRTAGIDLNRYFLGEVGLDDIFMELASKWDSLTTMQQRYIATQAAGSRQQSRFIALMSDYARTQELVGEAYNANGAAAKQFEKTQESLESKLARLKNAWDEFTMGILNSDLTKGIVDLLTNILNGVNQLTSGFGTLNDGIGGVINSVLKLSTLLVSLRLGKSILGGIGKGLMGTVTTAGAEAVTAAAGTAASNFKFLSVGAGLKTLGAGAAGSLKTLGAGFLKPLASLATSIAPLLPALGAIAAAAGTAYIAIKKLYDASPAGQIKIAEKYAASLSEVADAARSSQREIESIQEEYNRLEANVQQATTAEEKTAAIKSRTEYIQSLLEQNSAYAQYIDQYQVKNGEIFLTLDSDKLAEACEKIAETAMKVQSGVDIANANVAFQQYQKAQLDVEELKEMLSAAEDDRKKYYGNSEEEIRQWREDRDIDELEAELVSAQSRMIAFQKEYESFANLGILKYLTGIEEISGKKLTDESRTFAAVASKYSFSGDNIQKRIDEETKFFFDLLNASTMKTLEGAQDSFRKQFETTIIPDSLKNDKEGLINAVAFDKAINEILGPVSTNLAEGFVELDKEYQNILFDLMNTGGENLSETTIESIKKSGGLSNYLEEIWELLDVKLQEKLEDDFNSINQLNTARDVVAKTFKTGSQEYVDIIYKYLNNFIESFNLTNKQTGIVSKVFTDFAKDNYESLQPFTDFINNLITTVTNTKDPEIISSFFNTLATLDTDSASNIDVFFDLLDGLGIDFTKVEGSAEAAATRLKELANVKNPFNAEELSTKVSDAISTIWDIRERKPTQQGYRTFSENEYKAIQDAIEATGSKIDISTIFKRTGIKNKEWNYVGGDLEELVQLLIQDLNNAIQQAEDYISAPEWLQQQSDFATNDVIKVEDQNFTLEEAFREIISNPDFIEKLQNTEQFQPIIDILEKMGYTWSESLSRESLVGIISEALANYDQFLANKETQPEIDRAVQSVDYLTLVNELSQRPNITPERYENAIEGKFAVDEHAGDRYEDILKTIKQITAASEEWKGKTKEQEVLAKALSVNWSETAKKLSELTEILDKNDKILYEGSKDSYEYSSAIHAVGEAMRAVYGEQVSDEFIEAHIQQIMLARESKEAYQELLDLLQEDFFSNAVAGAQGFEGELWNLQQALIEAKVSADQLDGFEAHGIAILDGTPWMEVIAKLWGNLEAFEAYLATCGWTLVLSEDKDPTTGLPVSASLVRNQPAGYGGYQPYTGSNWGRGSGGGGGGSSKEKEPTKEEWRSDFDWLYNLMEDLAELQREQNKLQEEQNKILELANKNDTGKDLYDNLVKQMANLLTQKTYQSSVAGHRRQEMQEFMAANAGYNQYFRFNDKDQTLEINWDAINNIGDKETYEKVKDLVSEAEAIQKKMDESDDAVRDIEAQIRQLENIWREQFVDFEKRVLDALVKSYQRIIDNYSDLNDTVTRTNNDILTALQEEVALERQIRDNTKAEEAISDAEARLAFLRRDTTGGNQVQILAAQKQLDEQRREYEENLVDQSISRLQEDNEKAAEQREKQIELMQAQLNYAVENGEFNTDVYNLISGALGANGELLTNSDLFDLLQREESWAAMSATSKEVWEDELNNTFKEVSAYLLKEQGEADGSYLQAVASEINDGVWASANVVGGSLEVGLDSMGQSIGWAIGSMSQAIDHIVYSYDNAVNALSNANNQLAGAAAAAAATTTATTYTPSSPGSSDTSAYWSQAVWGIDHYGSGYTVTKDGISYSTPNQGAAYEAILRDLELVKKRGYKTGGLTTKTGPAWLDGTPSEPEYVLNARQTDAFLKLADILPSIFTNGSTTNNNTNSTMYLNFDINVDSISNDYDVDQLVERVKDDIYSVASYRNANIINFSR